MPDIGFTKYFPEERNISSNENRPVVCVQGLGFVGAAMAVAVASARDHHGEPKFNVIGVELPVPKGQAAIQAINNGKFPANITDKKLASAMQTAYKTGNLIATTDVDAYSLADVIIVDVHLDLTIGKNEPSVSFTGLENAIQTIGENMKPGALIIIEVTVPPGTCRYIIAPRLEKTLKARGLPDNAYLLAHSYERVMPSENYLDSILNYWRVYAGHTDDAAVKCHDFLSEVVNTREYPLTRLHDTTASETAKLLENSYRATNIAFIEEWGRFAEKAGIDLYQVIDAIRLRPTHSNIRTPGFGVGGYCLTKDPLFALVGARNLFGMKDHDFPFCKLAIETNTRMPFATIELLESKLGTLKNKKILLMGISYRSEIDDTRFSPSEIFYRTAISQGATLEIHDPLVHYWQELDIDVPDDIPAPADFDAIVFAVGHKEYVDMDVAKWLGSSKALILDTGNIFGYDRLKQLEASGYTVASIGRGNIGNNH